METAPTTLSATSAPASPQLRQPLRASRRVLWTLLVVYVLTLATVALWPSPVDAPASEFLAQITRALPWLTYPRIEFTANIALFVPMGVLLSLLLPRARWWVVPAAAAAFSICAELLQLLASDRTSSIADVVANTSGAAIGVLVVLVRTRMNPSVAGTTRSGSD